MDDNSKNAKKSRYSETQRKATNKYRQERAQIVLLMEKEQRERIKKAATDAGQSVNQFILDKVLKGL